MEVKGWWEIMGRSQDPFARCWGEGSPRIWAALVFLASPERCSQSSPYNQPASPGCTEKDGRTRLFHFFFSPSLEVDSDSAYKIERWCVLRNRDANSLSSLAQNNIFQSRRCSLPAPLSVTPGINGSCSIWTSFCGCWGSFWHALPPKPGRSGVYLAVT